MAKCSVNIRSGSIEVAPFGVPRLPSRTVRTLGAGFRHSRLVLPRSEKRNQFLALQAILPTLGLLVHALLPRLSGSAGWTFAVGAEVLTLWLLYYAAQLVLRRTNVKASRLLLASIPYLPVVFALMVLDRT